MANLRKKAHVDVNRAEDVEKGRLADVLTNIDSIKYFGKEKPIKRMYAGLADTARIKLIRFWNYNRVYGFGQNVILAIGTFFVMYFPLIKFLD